MVGCLVGNWGQKVTTGKMQKKLFDIEIKFVEEEHDSCKCKSEGNRLKF
jgi:hypothetical protein